MISKFITEVHSKFNPFSTASRSARIFLNYLPPDARKDGMKITTTLLPRSSTQPSTVQIKFKDGKELILDGDKLGVKGLADECDRHSRTLKKQAELND